MRLTVFIAALAACGCGGSATCRVAADCASGVCRSDGTCAPQGSSTSSGSTGTSSSNGGSTGSSSSSSSGTSSGSTGSTGSNTCLPNDDASVDRDEVTIEAGLHATFRIATNASFDTAGTQLADGGTFWDLTSVLASEPGTLVTLQSLSGQWFEADFPGATYASQLTSGSDLLGVFEATSDALELVGVVSPASGATQTELTYNPPAKVLAFPIAPGATWSTTSTVTGTLSGITTVPYFESYSSTVDAQGTLTTPLATFPVLRIATDATRPTGAQRTFLFATDCFGTVASITSQLGVSQGEFSSASELRGLSP